MGLGTHFINKEDTIVVISTSYIYKQLGVYIYIYIDSNPNLNPNPNPTLHMLLIISVDNNTEKLKPSYIIWYIWKIIC